MEKRRDGVKALFLLFIGLLSLGEVRAEVNNGTLVPGNVPLSSGISSSQPSVKIFKYRDKHGVRSFSDRAPVGTRYEVIQYSCFACNLQSTLDWHNIPLQLDAFEYTINSAAQKYQVDPALVRAVIHAESAFKPDAQFEKGRDRPDAIDAGDGQGHGRCEPTSPAQNIYGGVRYLAWLLQKNNGNTLLATASYNAGPGAVERYNGIPPFEETRDVRQTGQNSARPLCKGLGHNLDCQWQRPESHRLCRRRRPRIVSDCGIPLQAFRHCDTLEGSRQTFIKAGEIEGLSPPV